MIDQNDLKAQIKKELQVHECYFLETSMYAAFVYDKPTLYKVEI